MKNKLACSGRGIGPRGQPKAYLSVLVGGVVVYDQMHVERCRDGVVDALDEAEIGGKSEPLAAMRLQGE